tara:strand:+ start:1667 stop:2074 length:408 start_codon:yes stop_codon:yes gene_type:complete
LYKLKNKNMIIFFDGVCVLCESSVRYILNNDKKKKFTFSTLQGEYAKKILNPSDINALESIVLFDGKKVYDKSTAVIKICLILGGWYKLFYIAYIIPKSLRDSVYKLIAKKRYKWFGKLDNCMIPNKKIKSRFID